MAREFGTLISRALASSEFTGFFSAASTVPGGSSKVNGTSSRFNHVISVL
jgi:hypothetical protein